MEPIVDEECKTVITNNVATIALYMLSLFFTIFLCNFLHTLLRPLSQPRIISEFIVGLLLANTPAIRDRIHHHHINKTLNYVTDFGMVCHMFVFGLEIDHHIFLQPPTREAKVAFSGMLCTFMIAIVITTFLQVPTHTAKFNVTLSVILSGTASPLLARIITDLKIGKSDIGRFVVSTGVHSDLAATLFLCLGVICFDPTKEYRLRTVRDASRLIIILLIETILAARLSPVIMNWVNNENPEGKTMKGSHLILSIAYVVVLCGSSPTFAGFNSILSAFLVGLFLPREGRISRMMIGRVNYFLTTIFNPVFFLWVGVEADLMRFEGDRVGSWRLVLLFVTASVGKVGGTLVSAVMLGLHRPEAAAIGLLLNIKGHFHMYLAITAITTRVVTISTGIAMVFAIFLTIVYAPLVIDTVIERARKRSPTQKMALQWLDPTTELRILLCVHSPRNVPAAINFMEISRGPVDPGIMVCVTDMIELSDRIAATLVGGSGADVTMTVTDQQVVHMREEISTLVQAHVREHGEGISVKRMLALATVNSLHQDICILAEEIMASLVILPFHKDQQPDGRLNAGHSGFRHVNRKVLRHAPCSVGILVDRGFGSITRISRSSVSLNAAVIFIGGKDDREGLAYAGRVAQHPGVKLTVIRFLLDANSEEASSTRPGRPRMNTPEQEEEMRLDDEVFADFYEKHVASGSVAYMEKYLANSGQTFSTLRSLEGQYGLFIVGRGGRVNSVLTAGMNDWEECPELGPVGDILSASDFSVASSVLIIQQHNLRGELAGLDDEFTIM